MTHEPGDTPVGRTIRQVLLDPASDLDDRCEALLYAADKAQHIRRVVQPAVAAGTVVICDRYIDSMLAYQGAGRNLDMEELSTIIAWATYGVKPDLTVLLDADPQHAVSTKKTKDRLEEAGHDFHQRDRRGLLELAEADPARYLVLTALVSLPGIAGRVRERVSGLLGCPLAIPDLPNPAPRVTL